MVWFTRQLLLSDEPSVTVGIGNYCYWPSFLQTTSYVFACHHLFSVITDVCCCIVLLDN